MPRDINERGRDLDAVLTQYMTFVKPAFEEFCSPVSRSGIAFIDVHIFTIIACFLIFID